MHGAEGTYRRVSFLFCCFFKLSSIVLDHISSYICSAKFFNQLLNSSWAERQVSRRYLPTLNHSLRLSLVPFLKMKCNRLGRSIADKFVGLVGAGGELGLLHALPIFAILDVHCITGEKRGKLTYPLKNNVKLTNTCALVIRDFPDGVEIIGE